MLYDPKRTDRVVSQQFYYFIEKIIFEKLAMRSDEFEKDRNVVALMLKRKLNQVSQKFLNKLLHQL
jgi:hypothetical protein